MPIQFVSTRISLLGSCIPTHMGYHYMQTQQAVICKKILSMGWVCRTPACIMGNEQPVAGSNFLENVLISPVLTVV